MTRRILAGMAAGLLAAVALTGCGGTAAGEQVSTRDNTFVAERIVKLSDGRTVTCITIQSRGISCDFAGATRS